ncbi:hypothetical protein DL238_13470 [Alteriqipengyuania lutimaris]|uniref:Uncharacterized protein n=1 Tax=Alteriqipengyuania lutimaris TaxID=1538146 RepID=A0A395LGL1_9SPHN|nr:hypothetical protein [Alteriqipengyuania lutimaris]RDS75709.1 hypothetical protein DL238_13470 [Alteriqipengyuania lutimaris]
MTTTRALAAAALFLSAPATAQSLEQSYADQCSGGQKTEVCDVLRKALLEKLASGSMASDQVGADPLASDAWLAFAILADGGYWYAPGSILRFEPSASGQEIRFEDILREKSSSIELRHGRPVWTDASGEWITRVSGTTIEVTKGDQSDRLHFTLVDEGSQLLLERTSLFQGRPLQYEPITYRRLSPQEVAEAGQELKRVQNPVVGAQVWGALADRTGRAFSAKASSDGSQRRVNYYYWNVPGVSLFVDSADVTKGRISQQPFTWIMYSYDPMTKTVAGANADSVLVTASGLDVNYPEARVESRSRPSGGYTESTFRLKNGKWKKTITFDYVPAGPDIQSTIARLTAPKQRGSGGLFGTLLGAAVGGVAAMAGGADGATAAGLMLKGAAATSGNDQMATAMAKGSAEVAASNAQMEAQLQDSIDRGLAQGNAQYRAAQGSGASEQGASSSGIEVKTVEAAPALATVAAPSPAPAPAPKMRYWRCMAAKGGTPTIYSSTFGVPSGSRWNVMTLRSAYDEFLRGRGSGFLRDVGCSSASTLAEAETLSSFNTTGQTVETVAWAPE